MRPEIGVYGDEDEPGEDTAPDSDVGQHRPRLGFQARFQADHHDDVGVRGGTEHESTGVAPVAPQRLAVEDTVGDGEDAAGVEQGHCDPAGNQNNVYLHYVYITKTTFKVTN